MKIIGDYTFEFNKRRRILFRIEENDSAVDIALKLTGAFNEPAVILYKSGEIRIPASVCIDNVRLKQAIEQVNPDKIEIGEGSGNCEKFYEIYPAENDLICIGPADCDFYAEIKESGIVFTF